MCVCKYIFVVFVIVRALLFWHFYKRNYICFQLISKSGSAFASIPEELLELMIDSPGKKAAMHTGSSCAADESFDDDEQICCKRCPKGQGVVLPCTRKHSGYNNTLCEPCIKGRDFSATDSHVDSCVPCHICPANSHRIHDCNTTHNTKCECNAGYYGSSVKTRSARSDEEIRLVCLKCDDCPAGTRVVRSCEYVRNAQCEPCVNGTFSSRANSWTCQKCKKCPGGASPLKSCTATEDSLCLAGTVQ